MKLYLRLSGTTIIGHDFITHDDYQTEIEVEYLSDIVLLPYGYNTKYVNGALVTLTEQEMLAHPNYKASMISQLKIKAASAIATLDEDKVHSLAVKQLRGGILTQEEVSFIDSFLSQRQVILDQYEIDKAQYE